MTERQRIPRRQFIQQATAASAVGAFGLSAVAEAEAKKKDRDRNGKRRKKKKLQPAKHLRDLEHGHFEELIGHKFVVDGSRHSDEQHQATLILSSAKQHPHPSDEDRPGHLRKSGFTLLFIAREGEEIADGTHHVFHPDLCEMELFLHETIRGEDPHHKYYVATFN